MSEVAKCDEWASNETQEDVAILVHGTFSRKADWIKDDSEATTSLKKIPHMKVIPFIWSGKNSHAARINASNSLIDLSNDLKARGARRLWIIAHSHGGNVALNALHDPSMRSMTVGMAFWGTPFLLVGARNIQKAIRVFTIVFSWFLLFPVFMPYGLLVLVSIADSLGGPTAAGFQLIFGNGVIALIYLWLRPRLRRRSEAALIRLFSRLQSDRLKSMSVPTPDCPTLVAVVDRDEAGLLLRTIDKVSEVPWLVFGLLLQVVGAIVIGYLLAELSSMIIFGDSINELDATVGLLAFSVSVATAVIIGPMVIVFVVTAVRGTPAAFGYEGLLTTALVSIAPRSTPTWPISKFLRLTRSSNPPLRYKLRHSAFYRDRSLLEETVNWINQTALKAEMGVTPAAVIQSATGPIQRNWVQRSLVVLVATTMVALSYWLNYRKIEDVRRPRHDEQSYWAEFGNIPVAYVLDVDSDFDQLRDGPSPMEKPTFVEPEMRVAAKARCYVSGKFTFSHFGAITNLALHNTADPRFDDMTTFDLENPNRVKLIYGFFNTAAYREIWEWGSNEGTDVSFTRDIHNDFGSEAVVMFRVWNSSSTPVRVRGHLEFGCLEPNNLIPPPAPEIGN